MNEDQPRDELGRFTFSEGGNATNSGKSDSAGAAIRAAASDGMLSNAVAVYQSVLFDSINNELRYDKPDKFRDTIKVLDRAATDKTNDKLYRGLDSNFTKDIIQKHGIKDVNDIHELKAKLVGKTIHDKSFMSTTRDLSVAADFARDKGGGKTTVLQIEGAKKGIEVTKHVNNLRARKEKEFLIDRGATLKIKDVSLSKTGKLIIYTEIQ